MNRDQLERDVADAIRGILVEMAAQSAAAEAAVWDQYIAQLTAALATPLTAAHLATTQQVVTQHGVAIEAAQLAREAETWAAERATNLASEAATASRNGRSVASPVERANSIATTEVTRVTTVATAWVVLLMHADDPTSAPEPIWRAVDSPTTCPVCRRLDGMRQSEYQSQFPDGPPAHPNCRCTLTWDN